MLEKEIGGIEEIGEIIIELVHDDAGVSILTPLPSFFKNRERGRGARASQL
jgi:hypothetical protein